MKVNQSWTVTSLASRADSGSGKWMSCRWASGSRFMQHVLIAAGWGVVSGREEKYSFAECWSE